MARRTVVLIVSLTLAGAGLAGVDQPARAGGPPAPDVVRAPAPAPGPTSRPTLGTVLPLEGEPKQLITGPDGNVWVVVTTGANEDVAKVTPAGAVTYYDVSPTALGALAVAGGHLWAPTNGGVVKIPPADPTSATVTPNADVNDARGIARGPDGFLWVASDDKVVRFSPADPAGAVSTTVPGMSAREVTATATRVWVVDALGGRVLAFEPDASGTFLSKTVGGTPQGIGAGPGDQVLYTNPGTDPQTVGRVSPVGGPRLTAVPQADPSFSVGFGADGAYWVGLFNDQQMLRVTPQGATRRLFSFADPYKPRYVARGPGATIWVSLQNPGDTGALVRISGVRDDTVAVAVAGGKALVRKRTARVRLTCPATEINGPCRGRVVLRRPGGGAVLGRVAWSARAGATVVAKVPLSRRTVRSLPRRGLRATAVVSVRDEAGNTRTVRRSLRLAR